jgi:ribonuclease P/MRP protein subunit RPP40
MANKQHTLGIFLDFEKAFDLVWHKGITIKLKSLGVQGRIFAWIENFFQDCTLQVKVGSQLSDSFRLESGTAQGSVIPPLLFIIRINDLTRDLFNTEASLFADETAIFRSSRNITFLSAIMNKNLESISKWCDL